MVDFSSTMTTLFTFAPFWFPTISLMSAMGYGKDNTAHPADETFAFESHTV
jgi:hypothetical protein